MPPVCLFFPHAAYKCLDVPSLLGSAGLRSNTKKVMEQSWVVIVTWGLWFINLQSLNSKGSTERLPVSAPGGVISLQRTIAKRAVLSLTAGERSSHYSSRCRCGTGRGSPTRKFVQFHWGIYFYPLMPRFSSCRSVRDFWGNRERTGLSVNMYLVQKLPFVIIFTLYGNTQSLCNCVYPWCLT